ncbi:MAG: DNA mismatch repair protein MutS [Oscillospiraceae bacterium]|nr:DNA mismatch repair protein MutS [Oscillospiraceae bacterium]
MAELTPMKKQYREIKAQHQDCLLFFRLGDFYEMFDADAVTASRELDLALTTRDRNVEDPEERTPMCGVPYHSAEGYIAKLIAKGYKVAICEQMEDPALAKGLVQRDVIRIITPGTVTDSSMLSEERSNYISSVFLSGDSAGIAFCELSTGEFCCAAFPRDGEEHVRNELARFLPREVLLSPAAAESRVITAFLSEQLGAMPEQGAGMFEYLPCAARVCEQFGFSDVDEAGIRDGGNAVCACGALLQYLQETQKFDLSHINRLDVFFGGRYMELDYTARRSLELTEAMSSGEKKGSLLWVLDRTGTAMGSRMLRSWVERPLLSVAAIRRRLNAVRELFSDHVRRAELMRALKEISDMQRLVSRTVYGSAGGRDLRMLSNCVAVLPRLQELLQTAESPALQEIAAMDLLTDIREDIDRCICDDPPFSVREGGIIRDGFSAELDELRQLRDHGAEKIAALEERERQSTGIRKLKVGYNRVFGYYIDVPKSAVEAQIPEHFIRKQTLVSNERYFTPELKELENSLLTARDRIQELEYDFFCAVRDRVAGNVSRIQKTAELVAALDCFCSLAEVAVRNRYVMPDVDASRDLIIREGRHPVVEQTLSDVRFVPNDTVLNTGADRLAIVTGPNMAGKSTYMRQTALIVLMAQIGSFVPAASAVIGVTDRVFTRIGASDDLASGRSTFMVEMSEMANILRNATASSLLILDEIGRGTSTFDGMAIARAVLEYCADKRRLGARTMFATHYHELSALEGELEGIRNYNITAKKQNGKLVFLRKIVPGAADDSYGIEVAKLAGVPDSVIDRAKHCLRELTAAQPTASMPTAAPPEDPGQISFSQMQADEVREILQKTDLNTLTPLEALNLLYTLQRKAMS